MKMIYGLVLLAMLCTTGCATMSTNSHALDAGSSMELYVLAAASLTEAMMDVEAAFEVQYPEVDVVLNCASSGSLMQQIKRGAPADVFVSASLDKMKALDEEGYLKDGYTNFLVNELVLAVPAGGTEILGIEDLINHKEMIFSMGEPESVPAGRYAEQVLGYYGISQGIKPMTVIGKNVTEIITWLEAGEVDAGLVYETDAMKSTQVDIVETAPVDSHDAIVYPCAALGGTKQEATTKVFMDFLLSGPGIELFEAHGFTADQGYGR